MATPPAFGSFVFVASVDSSRPEIRGDGRINRWRCLAASDMRDPNSFLCSWRCFCGRVVFRGPFGAFSCVGLPCFPRFPCLPSSPLRVLRRTPSCMVPLLSLLSLWCVIGGIRAASAPIDGRSAALVRTTASVSVPLLLAFLLPFVPRRRRRRWCRAVSSLYCLLPPLSLPCSLGCGVVVGDDVA
jgi:hypothetical protein